MCAPIPPFADLWPPAPTLEAWPQGSCLLVGNQLLLCIVPGARAFSGHCFYFDAGSDPDHMPLGSRPPDFDHCSATVNHCTPVMVQGKHEVLGLIHHSVVAVIFCATPPPSWNASLLSFDSRAWFPLVEEAEPILQGLRCSS